MSQVRISIFINKNTEVKAKALEDFAIVSVDDLDVFIHNQDEAEKLLKAATEAVEVFKTQPSAPSSSEPESD